MFEEINNRWTSAGALSKALLIGGITAVLALFVFLTVWTLRDDYQVLFADLDAQDAALMVAELDRLKTPYKLAGQGTTILVDRDAVYKTRLKLMGKGLTLKGNVGFELFNNTDYGTTEFAQKVNYQRALQGELARTIMAIDEIKYARVHLVLPERGILKKQSGQAKASVSLAMKGDSRLSAEQVIGIQRLVAAATQEMEAAAVTVVDQRGVALTPNVIGDASSGWMTGKMEVKKDIESYLTKKISALLDKALGPGKALVSVDVALNYDQVKVTKEDIVPAVDRGKEAGGVVTRRQTFDQGETLYKDETKTALSLMIEPQLREVGNGRKARAIDADAPSGRRVEQIVSEPGNIRRISVGIFVPAGLSSDRLAQLREVIGMAAGLNSARGDAIAIQPVEPVIAVRSDAGVNAVAADSAPTKNELGEQPLYHATLTPAFQWLLGIGALLIFAGGAGLLIHRRKDAAGKKRLSPAEREKMLKQISDWVSAASVKQSASEKI